MLYKMKYTPNNNYYSYMIFMKYTKNIMILMEKAGFIDDKTSRCTYF